MKVDSMMKIAFSKVENLMFLRDTEKVNVSFGPVGRNMARKSPKIEIFSIGQKI